MSVESWAMTAYRHARVTLVIGASNNPAQVARTGGWSKAMVKLSRTAYNNWVLKDRHWVLMVSEDRFRYSGSPHERELAIAKRAAEHRAGNCGENAATVYAFLFERAQGKNIGHVSRMSCKKPGDHEFVVLNRNRAADGSIASWGPNSIVVDPWWGVVCAGSDVYFTTGNCIFAEEGIDPKDMQEYIVSCGTTLKTEFDTGAPQ